MSRCKHCHKTLWSFICPISGKGGSVLRRARRRLEIRYIYENKHDLCHCDDLETMLKKRIYIIKSLKSISI